MSCNLCNKEKAERLARFIANNLSYCPIDENVCVKGCSCWRSKKCEKCLLENVEHIKIENQTIKQRF